MISAGRTGRDSLLFVYGTLRAFVDIPMAQWLRRTARYVGPATTRGRLYDLGPFPGLCRARGRREIVVGEVYRFKSPRVLRILDRYETGGARRGARFKRTRCVVRLERRTREAWVYRYCRRIAASSRIRSGDYRLHRGAR